MHGVELLPGVVVGFLGGYGGEISRVVVISGDCLDRGCSAGVVEIPVNNQPSVFIFPQYGIHMSAEKTCLALADLFLAAEHPLVDWGEGWKKSSAKTNAISLPVAVLVNRMTTGAAEALAGMLRHRDVGLLLGTNTAGQASMAKEFTLKTGQRLRIAVAPLRVADDKELPFSGIKPDIEVAVDPLDELAWFENAYKVLAKPSVTAAGSTNDNVAALTNRAPRRRLNEADLVRMTREGQSQVRDGSPLSGNIQVKAEDQIPQVVNDPALARAIDLLKGLAVVQQFRSI